ncbi:MAG: endonuclease [Bacilli bacterium]|jgi:endonuclease I
MKIRRLLLGLVAVTVLVSCEPPAPSSEEVSESETSAVSASEESSSELSSAESSSAESSSEWVAPEPVRRVAEYWNFTPLSAYTGDFWSTIDFSLRGEDLRQALETYMWSKMKKVYYYDAFHAVKIMDADPNNPDNILSVYDLKSQPHAAYNRGKWNREHAFPQSKLADGDPSLRTGGAEPNISTDIANIFACDALLNENRSNYSYSEWNYDDDPQFYYQNLQRNTAGELVDSILYFGYYSPTPIVRGEIARSQLYMLIMYPDRCNIQENFRIEDMIKWDREWAPTEERDGQRQIGIEQYQKIRNPFIDNRNLSCYIWGDHNRACRKLCAGIY